MNTTTTAKQSRVKNSGQYGFSGDLTRVCKCGATLGSHSAQAPHDHEENDCPKFRPAKA